MTLWLLDHSGLTEERRASVADFLTGGYVTHDQPLTWETVQRFELDVSGSVPDPVYELFETCEFGECNRPRLIEVG